MSEGQPKPYTIEDGAGVKDQVRAIRVIAQQAGKLESFLEIMEKAGRNLRTDPNGWGDPEFTAKTVNAEIRHGIIRPISFRFAVYDDIRAVVILRVNLFTKFA